MILVIPILRVLERMKTIFVNSNISTLHLCFCDATTSIKKRIKSRIILYDWYTILPMDIYDKKEILKLTSHDSSLKKNVPRHRTLVRLRTCLSTDGF